jgi:putative chitinase
MNLNLGFTRALIDECKAQKLLRNQCAYVLATAYWETARTMRPIEEFGKGRGRKYGLPAGKYGRVYYGRGYVQLTWLANYLLASTKIGVDFVQFPEKALDPVLAAKIAVTGMLQGWFTGRKLSDYITLKSSDYQNARRIINGKDQALKIAAFAVQYDAALKTEGYN